MRTFRATSQPAGGDKYRTWDAAYVLGSLSREERIEFESHLRGCPACSSAVSELADIAGLLAQLDVRDFDALDQSPRPHAATAVAPRLVGPTPVWRRPALQAALVAAACIAATAIVIGALAFLRSDSLTSPPPASSQAQMSALPMTPVRPSSLTATVSLVGRSGDTEIQMRCTYGQEPDGGADSDELAMVVVGRDGTRRQLTNWVGHSGTTTTPAGIVALPVGQIAEVQVVSADTGDVLLNRIF